MLIIRMCQAEVVIGQCGCNETMVEQVRHKFEYTITKRSPIVTNFTIISTSLQTVMGLATVLPKGDRGEVGRPGRQGVTGPPVIIEKTSLSFI